MLVNQKGRQGSLETGFVDHKADRARAASLGELLSGRTQIVKVYFSGG